MAFIQKASKYTNQERKDRLGKRREDSTAGPKKMSSGEPASCSTCYFLAAAS